jgi:hypothetical protein
MQRADRCRPRSDPRAAPRAREVVIDVQTPRVELAATDDARGERCGARRRPPAGDEWIAAA